MCVFCASESGPTPGSLCMTEWCSQHPVRSSPAQLPQDHVWLPLWSWSVCFLCLSSLCSSHGLLLLFFTQHYFLFLRTLTAFSRHAQSQTVQFSHFLPPAMFLALFVLGPTWPPFWRSRVSTELSCNTILQMNQYVPASLLPTFIFIFFDINFLAINRYKIFHLRNENYFQVEFHAIQLLKRRESFLLRQQGWTWRISYSVKCVSQIKTNAIWLHWHVDSNEKNKLKSKIETDS